MCVQGCRAVRSYWSHNPNHRNTQMDLHHLVQRKMEWDNVLSDDLRQVWIDHFEMLAEIKDVYYKHSVVPEDAASLDVETLDFGDVSAAIHIRFKKKDSTNSCQLIFARSRLVSDESTQPRGELLAAVINLHTGNIIKRAFGDRNKSSFKLTDSLISLFWICNNNLILKQWTRNRVVEILIDLYQI